MEQMLDHQLAELCHFLRNDTVCPLQQVEMNSMPCSPSNPNPTCHFLHALRACASLGVEWHAGIGLYKTGDVINYWKEWYKWMYSQEA